MTPEEIEKERSTVEVKVLDQEEHDGGAFDFGNTYQDGTLDRVIKSLVAIRNSIPEQYRATAYCGISSTSGYEGDHYGHVEVSYRRPETDAEVVGRMMQAKARAKAQEAQERAVFEALKKRYG